MDPLFVANPSPAEIGEALQMWGQLPGSQIRPLLVTAFGDIFVETEGAGVYVVSPIELACESIAKSVEDLQWLFSDPVWAQRRLLTDLALFAQEQGITREDHQVFSIAPHPCFTGSLADGTLMAMDLTIWHSLATQIRDQTGRRGPSLRA